MSLVLQLHVSWEKDSDDFKQQRIPGALCFHGWVCRDNDSPYKNMLPTAEFFEEWVNFTVTLNF